MRESAQTPVSTHSEFGWWPPSLGHVRQVQGDAQREAAGCRGGSSSEKAEARQRQGKHSRYSHQQLPARLGSRARPPAKLWGLQPAPRRVQLGFLPLPGAPRGTRRRGQPGVGTHHDATAARLACPRAAAAPHRRDGRAAATLYRGRHRPSGAERRALDSSGRLHKFVYNAHISIHLHRCSCVARQPAVCIAGATKEQHPPPQCSLPPRGHGKPGHPLEERAGGHKDWSCYTCWS